mgnify:CR=1 FL=1
MIVVKVVVKVKEIGKRGRYKTKIMDYGTLRKILRNAKPLNDNEDKPIAGKWYKNGLIYKI